MCQKAGNRSAERARNGWSPGGGWPRAKRDILACGKILPIIWYQRFSDCSHVRVISLIRLLPPPLRPPPPPSSIITRSASELFNLLSPRSILLRFVSSAHVSLFFPISLLFFIPSQHVPLATSRRFRTFSSVFRLVSRDIGGIAISRWGGGFRGFGVVSSREGSWGDCRLAS